MMYVMCVMFKSTLSTANGFTNHRYKRSALRPGIGRKSKCFMDSMDSWKGASKSGFENPISAASGYVLI